MNLSCFHSTEINLTTSSDENKNKDNYFSSSIPFSSTKTKIAKSSHPKTNHRVGSESHYQA
jgi:hypothetical protein